MFWSTEGNSNGQNEYIGLVKNRWESFVFSNEWGPRISRHLIFWLAWLLFHGIIYGSFWRGGGAYTFQDSIWNAITRAYYISFTEAFLFMPAHLFLSYGIIYFLFPRYLFQRKYFQLIAGFAVLLLLTASFSHVLSITVIREFRQSLNIPNGVNTFLFGLMAGLRGSNTVAGFAAAIKLMKVWYQKNEEAQKLEKAKLRAELESLRNQLHPHFLFNTLNSLYSLTLHQSKQAPQMVVRLSELLRYILTDCNQPAVPLKTEIALLTNYIELEKIRVGDRLDVSIRVPADTEQYQIAPLLLLPFIENSFKHGVRDQSDAVWISMFLDVRDDHLHFQLVNGKSQHPNTLMQSTGIGLQNVQKRLELLYPNQYKLRLTETDDTFIVNLIVPLAVVSEREPNQLEPAEV